MRKNQKHHYLPIFYLSRWTSAADHKLQCFQRINGRIVTSRLAPKHTAYERGLNSLSHTSDPAIRDMLEEKFFSGVIDSQAAPAIKIVADGKGVGLMAEHAVRIAMFMLSIRARHPEAMRSIREVGTQLLTNELNRDPAEYDAIRAETDPSTLLAYMRDVQPFQLENFAMMRLPTLVTNERLVMRAGEMLWRVIDCSKARVDLLLGDRPCLIEGNWYADGPCVIVFPISPTVLLVLGTDRKLLDRATRGRPTELVKRVNKYLVQQSWKRVFAIDTLHLPLIEKYLDRGRT